MQASRTRPRRRPAASVERVARTVRAEASSRRSGSPTAAPRPGSRRRPQRRSLAARRRRAVALFFSTAVIALGIAAVASSSGSTPNAATKTATNAPPTAPATPFRSRIVTIAEHQIGYRTVPAHSYCNKYSAYWGAGSPCAHGLRSEEWCADFAAWVWRRAGAQFTYSTATDALNAAAASFYTWAVDHGTWHPARDGYVPLPGDVAVYGLETTPTTGIFTAAHVAIVTSDTKGARGPDVVNGDGDRTGFSVVETGRDQYKADVPGGPAYLSGYASPVAPAHGSAP